jgi:hypothetical protein
MNLQCIAKIALIIYSVVNFRGYFYFAKISWKEGKECFFGQTAADNHLLGQLVKTPCEHATYAVRRMMSQATTIYKEVLSTDIISTAG